MGYIIMYNIEKVHQPSFRFTEEKLSEDSFKENLAEIELLGKISNVKIFTELTNQMILKDPMKCNHEWETFIFLPSKNMELYCSQDAIMRLCKHCGFRDIEIESHKLEDYKCCNHRWSSIRVMNATHKELYLQHCILCNIYRDTPLIVCEHNWMMFYPLEGDPYEYCTLCGGRKQ